MEVRSNVDETLMERQGSVSNAVDVVLEEGLANAYRHGNATRVDVSITGDGVAVVIQLVDDGAGVAASSPGMGSRRMQAVGQVELVTGSGGGSVLTVVISADSISDGALSV